MSRIAFRVDTPGNYYAYAWVNDGDGWILREFRAGYTPPRLSKYVGWFMLLASLILLTAAIG